MQAPRRPPPEPLFLRSCAAALVVADRFGRQLYQTLQDDFAAHSAPWRQLRRGSSAWDRSFSLPARFLAAWLGLLPLLLVCLRAPWQWMPDQLHQHFPVDYGRINPG